ncbi:hypothetical protein ABIC22_000898 [Paenibacillus sp. PvP094]
MSMIFPDIVTDRLKLVVLTLDDAESVFRHFQMRMLPDLAREYWGSVGKFDDGRLIF